MLSVTFPVFDTVPVKLAGFPTAAAGPHWSVTATLGDVAIGHVTEAVSVML